MAELSESEYNRRVDTTLLAVEEAIDAGGADIDYENVGGILTLHCTNGSQIILNRQTPLRQLWVAARSGGFHFDWDDDAEAWLRDSDSTPLDAVLRELLAAQCGEELSFEL